MHFAINDAVGSFCDGLVIERMHDTNENIICREEDMMEKVRNEIQRIVGWTVMPTFIGRLSIFSFL